MVACGRSHDAPDSGSGAGGVLLPLPWECNGALPARLEPPQLTGDCGALVAHYPARAYDDCDQSPTDATPEQCGVARQGGVFCTGNVYSARARLTVTCLSDADCPDNMQCTVGEVATTIDPSVFWAGQCELACEGGDRSECLRCDMECDVDQGVCRVRRPEPALERCTVDCDCDAGGLCLEGNCLYGSGVTEQGICGRDCGCAGGECVGRCCILPDGTRASPLSAVCRGVN
jgi:hypothetical protein